jgi:CheY-like chemotaxis protein
MIKKDIWIVDDDAIYQIIVNKIIQRSEMFSTISSFKNGKDALDYLHIAVENNTALPDIILLDINMPIMDGWEFMEEMGLIKCKFNKQITVYIVSSSIAIEDKNKSKSYENILGYLSKPITVNDLLLISSDD